MDLGRILGGFWKDFSKVFRIFLKNCDFVKYSVLPRKNHYFSYVELLKINKKTAKNRQKINANFELQKNSHMMASKRDLGRSWARLGRELGQSGASFGHFWPVFGRFFALLN